MVVVRVGITVGITATMAPGNMKKAEKVEIMPLREGKAKRKVFTVFPPVKPWTKEFTT